MRLVLCSEGFHTQNSVDACVKLVGKTANKISAGIINEAYAEDAGDKRWVLDNLNTVATNIGGEIDLINLLALTNKDIEKRLANKDIIFVVGGNTDYLMSVFVKTGFDKLLPRLLASKVYVGSSAGSMVIGKRLSTAAYRHIYGEDSKWNNTDYLGLVDFSIIPHLDSPHFPNREDTLMSAVGKNTTKVYGLRDDSAVIVNGDDISFTGSDPVILD